MSKRAPVSDDEDSGSDISLVDVEFDFFSPNPDVDYQAVKRLLQQLFGRDHELFNLHELTELILSQNYIGTTIKTDGEESDPYALLTVLNMHTNHQHPSMKALAQYILSKAESASSDDGKSLHSTLQSLFSQSESHIGLVISERLINMPVEVIPPLYTMLKDEVKSLSSQGHPFTFSHLLFISRMYHLSEDEESMLRNKMPESEARKKGGGVKKGGSNKKQRANMGSHGHEKMGEAQRPEDGDALIAQFSSHTLNYTYTTPPPETHQESRGKDAFGLDTRGRIMLLPLDFKPIHLKGSDAMDTDDGSAQDSWDVLAERMSKVYGVRK
ncbi:p21-C-terminal region-binding protein-domain-containing protein [Coprinopsis sp. MPI-PUGE-AT-0042]|nr:p21-C-terminal region-binding protein-domain-containing protein [Coprinopsis sp. MPI-PUGE-AT-0042]